MILRAARNLRGKAILYADTVTGSMQAAIAETDRRRAKQVEYNLKHGITPRSVIKKITDIMEGARGEDADRRNRRGAKGGAVAEQRIDYAALSPEQLAAKLKKLEAQMFKHAQDLEFEDAARVRDEIKKVKAAGFMA